MTLQEEIASEAARRHDARCIHGIQCPSRDWHIQNDYIKNAAREIIAFRLAEIDNVRQYYELR